MISPTYVDDFYCCAKYPSENREKVERISDKIYRQILVARSIAKYPDDYGCKIPELEREILYATNLNGVKAIKKGNCAENAMAAMAVLCANGYYNSERVDLCLKAEFKNKKTGETPYSKALPLDHSFVITDMNSRKEKDIIIDPWLGFADSKTGAIARFKQIYRDRDIKDYISMHKSAFRYNLLSENPDANMDDYEMKTEFIFKPTEPYTTDYQLRRLGEYSRAMFDGIMLNKKEKSN